MTTTAGENRTTPDVSSQYVPEFLSETGQRIAQEVSKLIPLMREAAPEAERLGALTPETVRALSETGVFHLTTPIELGGHAVGARDMLEAIATVGRGDGSAAWLVSAATGNNVMALAYPQQAIDEVYDVSEGWEGPLLVGASLFATRVGSARKVDGGWLVRGKWGFGSGCKHAAWAMVGVEFEDDNGPGRGQVILSRDQYTILDDWNVMGMCATSSNTLVAETEVLVPAHRFIKMSDLPMLMDGLRGKYQGVGFTWGSQGRVLAITLSSAGNALGMARGALECFAEQAPARKPFNLPYPTVADTPSTQVTAGRTRAMINAAQAVMERHADAVDRRSLAGGDFTEDEASELHMDLIYAIRLCADAVDMMQIALGSSTVSLKNPIQRFARDLRVLSTHGAIRFDPMAEINGRDVFGLESVGMFAGGLPNVG
ncbi:acyl-CoA dehydrogenase family protein [Streptomyces sp. cg40]|uniref:acyl-CoA dehydrogenase family protein n=1 Tax=Streptomyces sp. cg40 TaxID=3419764 RepID=UPI003CFC64AB